MLILTVCNFTPWICNTMCFKKKRKSKGCRKNGPSSRPGSNVLCLDSDSFKYIVWNTVNWVSIFEVFGDIFKSSYQMKLEVYFLYLSVCFPCPPVRPSAGWSVNRKGLLSKWCMWSLEHSLFVFKSHSVFKILSFIFKLDFRNFKLVFEAVPVWFKKEIW